MRPKCTTKNKEARGSAPRQGAQECPDERGSGDRGAERRRGSESDALWASENESESESDALRASEKKGLNLPKNNPRMTQQ